DHKVQERFGEVRPDLLQYRTCQSALTKLDYLSNDLGINCVSLMPITESGEEHDWGYTIRHFFSIQSTYGKSSDLKQLIDECHLRHIRVIFDAVCNHCNADCPLYKIDPTSYFYWKEPHHPEGPKDEIWGPEFNYEEKEQSPAWNYMTDVIQYYIREFHIDGL
ncbi:unnamed protein product, partial [Didymodactylos carnosus]